MYNDPLSGKGTEGVMVPSQERTEDRAVMKKLLAAIVAQNRLLYDTSAASGDRRNQQSYFLEAGALLDPNAAENVFISVDASHIAQRVSPSLASWDVEFNVGLDGFAIQRKYNTAAPGDPINGFDRVKSLVWPVAVLAPAFQSETGSRYLAMLVGDSAASGNPAAVIKFNNEFPSRLTFQVGLMSAIPTNLLTGVVDRKVYPLNEDDPDPPRWGTPPVAAMRWSNQFISALNLRFFVQPAIRPRAQVQEQ